MNREKVNIENLFHSKKYLKICAPMVRYSKLPFRKLVRKYDCDLCFTPMIMTDSFVQSDFARQNEFSTDEDDSPLIVQFAADNSQDLVDAAELVYPYCDGIDLNCGCPQSWAMKRGIGASLLKKPEELCEMIKQVRNRLPNPFSISAKIRLCHNISDTVKLCQNLERCGITFITVHTRTPNEKKAPANHNTLDIINSSTHIPIVANGDVTSLSTCDYLYETFGCKGMMSARGLLRNPSLFCGEVVTKQSCIKEWVDLALSIGCTYPVFHNHLQFMTEQILSTPDRRVLHSLNSVPAILIFLKDRSLID